jgi:hypothetical protein
MKVNAELSRNVAGKVAARPKECWRNAIMGLAVLPGAFYVEGWIITTSGLVVEHAWLELDDEMVDPTLYQEKGTRYFPGQRYDLDTVSTFLLDGDEAHTSLLRPGLTFPLACNSTERFPEYSAAFNRAWKEAIGESLQGKAEREAAKRVIKERLRLDREEKAS